MQVGIVHAVLTIVYAAVGLTLALVARYDKLVPPAASAFVAILWLGFILAISFTEAWIKFRAPFVPRHLALDIGRTVFAGLNAVESGLCLGLWLVYGIGASADEDRLGLLIALTVVFIAQVVYIHPKLYLRGDFAIYEELKRAPEDLLSHQMMIFSEMQDTVTNNAQPPAFFHIIYVLGEVAKVVLLVLYSVHFLRQLSGTA